MVKIHFPLRLQQSFKNYLNLGITEFLREVHELFEDMIWPASLVSKYWYWKPLVTNSSDLKASVNATNHDRRY